MQFEYLTAGLALANKFIEMGEEYSKASAETLRSSLSVLCGQITHLVSTEAMDGLCKGLAKDLWEVCLFYSVPLSLSSCVPPVSVVPRESMRRSQRVPIGTDDLKDILSGLTVSTLSIPR